MNSARPRLSTRLSPDEFKAWYWLKNELASFCRQQGLPTSGTKAILQQRVEGLLSGRKSEPVKLRRSARGKMPASFTLKTRIGPGWRCSRQLGDFLREHCGRSFHFNAAVRDFIHQRNGATLAEVVICYQKTAGRKRRIEPQFEYNRHVREFFQANPSATKQQMLAAWWTRRGRQKNR